MTQAQQSEAQRLAAICETKGMFPVADELNRMHARILELEQGKCLHQIAEPATPGDAVRAFRDYLGVHDGIKLGGQAMDDMALDLARIALDFKHLVEPRHPDDAAVDALAALMKAKLAKQRGKGYGGWDTECTQQRLSELLRGHVDKGDPVDVANFCAFLLARGEGIAAGPQAVPMAIDAKQIKTLMVKHRIWIEHSTLLEDDLPPRELRAVQAEQHQFEAYTKDLIALAATQPAVQGLDAPNEWEGIHTMPTCDDLIWLYCQDTNTIDGPIAPDPSLEQYGWTHWAYANAPSTAGIDAAQAKQGGAA
jgi:hypothetical protein